MRGLCRAVRLATAGALLVPSSLAGASPPAETPVGGVSRGWYVNWGIAQPGGGARLYHFGANLYWDGTTDAVAWFRDGAGCELAGPAIAAGELTLRRDIYVCDQIGPQQHVVRGAPPVSAFREEPLGVRIVADLEGMNFDLVFTVGTDFSETGLGGGNSCGDEYGIGVIAATGGPPYDVTGTGYSTSVGDHYLGSSAVAPSLCPLAPIR